MAGASLSLGDGEPPPDGLVGRSPAGEELRRCRARAALAEAERRVLRLLGPGPPERVAGFPRLVRRPPATLAAPLFRPDDAQVLFPAGAALESLRHEGIHVALEARRAPSRPAARAFWLEEGLATALAHGAGDLLETPPAPVVRRLAGAHARNSFWPAGRLLDATISTVAAESDPRARAEAYALADLLVHLLARLGPPPPDRRNPLVRALRRALGEGTLPPRRLLAFALTPPGDPSPAHEQLVRSFTEWRRVLTVHDEGREDDALRRIDRAARRLARRLDLCSPRPAGGW